MNEESLNRFLTGAKVRERQPIRVYETRVLLWFDNGALLSISVDAADLSVDLYGPDTGTEREQADEFLTSDPWLDAQYREKG